MDAPGQTDTMKEALGVLGDYLDSPEIRMFLKTGEVGGGQSWDSARGQSSDSLMRCVPKQLPEAGKPSP